MAERILESLPADYRQGHFIGRAQSPDGPCVIAIEGGMIHRVRLGPYPNPAALAKAKAALAGHGIDAMAIKAE